MRSSRVYGGWLAISCSLLACQPGNGLVYDGNDGG